MSPALRSPTKAAPLRSVGWAAAVLACWEGRNFKRHAPLFQLKDDVTLGNEGDTTLHGQKLHNVLVCSASKQAVQANDADVGRGCGNSLPSWGWLCCPVCGGVVCNSRHHGLLHDNISLSLFACALHHHIPRFDCPLPVAATFLLELRVSLLIALVVQQGGGRSLCTRVSSHGTRWELLETPALGRSPVIECVPALTDGRRGVGG